VSYHRSDAAIAMWISASGKAALKRSTLWTSTGLPASIQYCLGESPRKRLPFPAAGINA
jgi:hypothetical protein